MPGLIGLDWGTSNLRADWFDAEGRIRDARSRPWGIRRLPEGGFDAALLAITEGWPALPRLACGMVGSRDGWSETHYLDLPTDAGRIGRAVGHLVAADGREVQLVPGLRDPHRPDVMRGEETQVVGALALRPALVDESMLIMPGTHSKWVSVRNGAVVGFRTLMTGELYDLLVRHSILGTGNARTTIPGESFTRGVVAARDSGVAGALSRLFSARTLMLDGRLAPGAVADYLSGLLVGEEFRSAIADGLVRRHIPMQLIGDAALCERYRLAAACFDIEPEPPLEGATARGLWQLATLVGITGPIRADVPT